MSIMTEMRDMALGLASRMPIPKIAGILLLQLVAERKHWGAATQKLCFQACDYDLNQ